MADVERITSSGLGDGRQAIDTYFDRTRPWEKSHREFRDYNLAPQSVKDFYKDNHHNQTVAFVQRAREEYSSPESRTLKMSMYEMAQISGQFIDASDPDARDPQIVHAYQSALSVKRNGGPRWMEATAFIHDVGKILGTNTLMEDPLNPRPALPQWAVVGDTFPVGAKFSDSIVLPQYLHEYDGPDGGWEGNPDDKNPEFNTPYGMYRDIDGKGVGLDNILVGFSHDWYLAEVVRDVNTIPEAAKKMIELHSLYPLHYSGDYRHLIRPENLPALSAARGFNKYDLYSKDDAVPKKVDGKPIENYFKEITEEFFPDPLKW